MYIKNAQVCYNAGAVVAKSEVAGLALRHVKVPPFIDVDAVGTYPGIHICTLEVTIFPISDKKLKPSYPVMIRDKGSILQKSILAEIFSDKF
jgi:hypothetical protein